MFCKGLKIKGSRQRLSPYNKYHQYECVSHFCESETCAYQEISISCVWLPGQWWGHLRTYSADWVYLPTSLTSSHCPVTHICEGEADQDTLKTHSTCHPWSSKEFTFNWTRATHDLNSCLVSAILKWKKLLETTGR